MQINPCFKYFNLPELKQEASRVKLCYAFLQSKRFYHQELVIYNPNPVQFDSRHVFPKDLRYFWYHVDLGRNQVFPTLDMIQKMAAETGMPIQCIGSHNSFEDNTFQLVYIPHALAKNCDIRSLLFIRFLVPLTEREQEQIVETLEEEYMAL